MDLEALIGTLGEELAEKVAKIDEGMLVQLTVGSKAAASRMAADLRRPTSIEADNYKDIFYNFSKAGDGFVNVWGQAPPPQTRE